MRKFGIVLAALACLSLMAFPVQAAKGDFTFGLDGGMGIPTGDFGDAFNAGVLGGVFGDYQIHEMIAVGVDGSYSQYKGKDLPADITDLKATLIQGGAHVKVMPQMKDMKVLPYLQVGAGIYNVKGEQTSTNADASGSETKSKFGFYVGVGADYQVNPQIGVGLFGAYHDVPDAFDFGNGDTATTKAANMISVGVKVTFSTSGAKK
jgi:opacity protein-like surface antigen